MDLREGVVEEVGAGVAGKKGKRHRRRSLRRFAANHHRPAGAGGGAGEGHVRADDAPAARVRAVVATTAAEEGRGGEVERAAPAAHRALPLRVQLRLHLLDGARVGEPDVCHKLALERRFGQVGGRHPVVKNGAAELSVHEGHLPSVLFGEVELRHGDDQRPVGDLEVRLGAEGDRVGVVGARGEVGDGGDGKNERALREALVGGLDGRCPILMLLLL